MDVSEWQDRLEQTFMENGVVGGSLLDVLACEQAYFSYVEKNCHGYLVLTDSFFSFYVDTLRLADSQRLQKGSALTAQRYGSLLLHRATNFRIFRAAENLLIRGYPLSGYALLRDLKDQAIIFAAVANRMTTYDAVTGFNAVDAGKSPLDENDLFEMEKSRRKEEERILKLMIGGKSGLDKGHSRELWLWEKMFHQEVHGARLTFSAEGIAWAQNQRPLPVEPSPNLRSVTMYVNRSNEIGWMLLRTLPFLQLESAAFGREWAQKWRILDESFRFAIESLGKMGKKIASAFIHFIDKKFLFNPEDTYYQE